MRTKSAVTDVLVTQDLRIIYLGSKSVSISFNSDNSFLNSRFYAHSPSQKKTNASFKRDSLPFLDISTLPLYHPNPLFKLPLWMLLLPLWMLLLPLWMLLLPLWKLLLYISSLMILCYHFSTFCTGPFLLFTFSIATHLYRL
jgi:hypothetical protein